MADKLSNMFDQNFARLISFQGKPDKTLEFRQEALRHLQDLFHGYKPKGSMLWLLDQDGHGFRLTPWVSVDCDYKSQDSFRCLGPARPGTSTFRMVDLAYRGNDKLCEQLGLTPYLEVISQMDPETKTICIGLLDHATEDEDGRCEMLGAISVTVSDTSIASKTKFIDRFDEALNFAQAVGAFIKSNRTGRVSAAIGSFQDQVNNRQSGDEIFEHASTILKEWANADQCCIFRPSVGGSLVRVADKGGTKNTQALAADSFTARLLASTEEGSPGTIFRVANLFDKDERLRVFGDSSELTRDELPCDASEEHGLSAMFMILTCRRAGDEPGNLTVPNILLRLFTVRKVGFEGGHFSKTHEKILKHIGHSISNILPGLHVQKKVEALNEYIIQNENLIYKPTTTHEESETIDFQQFAAMVEKHIDPVSHCYIVDTTNSDERNSVVCTSSHGSNNTENTRIIEEHIADGKANNSIVHGNGVEGRKYFYYSPIYESGSRSLKMACQLSHQYLGAHDEVIIDRIASDLRLALLQATDAESMISQLADVRHTLRATIDGMASSAAAVCRRLRFFRNLPEHKHGDIVDEITKRARLNKDVLKLSAAVSEVDSLFETIQLMQNPDIERKVQFSRVDMKSFIALRISEMSAFAELRGIHIDQYLDWPHGLLNPQINHQLCKIIVFNLIDNAIKYSHQNERIEVHLAPAGGGLWELAVVDTGQYISPDARRKIFAPFQRLKPASGQSGRPGTGLGLSAVDRAMKLHSNKAKIDVSSEPILRQGNRGEVIKAKTTFTIRMPLNLY
ncbi:MAG: sensor histidine kinase [Pseudomonadota bacterium]